MKIQPIHIRKGNAFFFSFEDRLIYHFGGYIPDLNDSRTKPLRKETP